MVLDGHLPCQLSPGPHQIDDRVPDGRRQAMPVGDQLAECLVLPDMFRPATRGYVATFFWNEYLWK